MMTGPRVETLPTRLGQAVRRVEPHAKLSLSDIILGGQDGLVNVLGVVLGVAAASSDPRIVIAGGLAATFAESISMGAVAYTSTLADRDFYLSEIEREKREIRDMPDLERKEIEDIFAGWGFEGDLRDQAVEQVMKDEQAWVDVMMHNELKLSPVDSARALRSAAVVGIAAIIGSLIPLAPFFFTLPPLPALSIPASIVIAIALAAVTLFAVGAFKARTTVGHPGKSGLQMAVIGTVSALAGYFVGALLSVPPAP